MFSSFILFYFIFLPLSFEIRSKLNGVNVKMLLMFPLCNAMWCPSIGYGWSVWPFCGKQKQKPPIVTSNIANATSALLTMLLPEQQMIWYFIVFECFLFHFVLFRNFSVRVQCSENYFNTTCTTFCRPRNDQFGHYTCGERGNKVCLSGWKGANCEKGW